MNLLLTYPSALEFWLNPNHDVNSYTHLDSNINLSELFETKALQREHYGDIAEQLRVTLPVHALVSGPMQRRNSSQSVFHVVKNPLPPGSIVKVGHELYVISPELCFLIAARYKSFVDLVRIGIELCAKYRKDRFDPLAQVTITPVTDRQKICAYLKKASGISGVKLASRAIKYVLNNSGSYMETNLALLGSIPIHEGGYGLPEPQLNYMVRLNTSAMQFLGRDICECDEVWVKNKVALEYDSTLYHLQKNQFMYDKRKSTALTLSGFRVLNITSENIKSFTDIENLFFSVRKALGCEKRGGDFAKTFELRWQVVHYVMSGYIPEV